MPANDLSEREARLIEQALRAEALAIEAAVGPTLRLVLLREAWELREQIRCLSRGDARSWAPKVERRLHS